MSDLISRNDEDITPLSKGQGISDVLDKIRAEIMELFKEPAYYIPNYDAYKRVLDIIDKCKAESEDR